MREVAEADLAEYLVKVDGLASEDPDKDVLRTTMVPWPGCLIQAIDYPHEMKSSTRILRPQTF